MLMFRGFFIFEDFFFTRNVFENFRKGPMVLDSTFGVCY